MTDTPARQTRWNRFRALIGVVLLSAGFAAPAEAGEMRPPIAGWVNNVLYFPDVDEFTEYVCGLGNNTPFVSRYEIHTDEYGLPENMDLWCQDENGSEGRRRFRSYGRRCPQQGSAVRDERGIVIGCRPREIIGKAPQQCPVEGNPVVPSSGNKFQVETDYAGRGDFPLRLERTYNSRSLGFRGSFGEHWSGFYDRKLVGTFLAERSVPTQNRPLFYRATPEGVIPRQPYFQPSISDERSLTFIREDGRQIYFRRSGGQWQADADVNYRAESRRDSQQNLIGFRLTTPGDIVEIYDTLGRLVRITNRQGFSQTLSYDETDGTLSEVIGPYGRSLTFEHQAYSRPDAGTAYRVSRVTDPAGRVYRYRYDADNNLTEVIYPDLTAEETDDNPRRLYHYENTAFPHALTGISDANNNRFARYGYNADGRAVFTEHGGGAGRVEFTYNSDDSTTVTGPLGAQRTYTYQLVEGVAKPAAIDGDSCADCGTAGSAFSYDSRGDPDRVTDFNGTVTDYDHNARGLETRRIEAVGTGAERTVTTEWHPEFRWPVRITEPGRTTEYTYDDNGNRLTETVTDTTGLCADGQGGGCSRTTTFAYNSDGLLASEDGPRTDVNDVTTYEYDAQGNRIRITRAGGRVTELPDHDAHGNPLTIIDPNGVRTELEYDARQRLIRRTVAAGTVDAATTEFEYDAAGQLIRITRPDGSELRYTYDAAHRLTAVEDSHGNRIEYSLDAAGNRTATDTYDPNGALTRSQSAVFNELSRLVEQVGADSQTTAYEYDANGNRTAVTDPNAQTTTRAFDALDRLIEVVDPENGEADPTRYAYDAQDNLTAVTDPKGLTTDYTYNGFGELIEQTSPDTGTTTYQYDAAGNRVQQTDARGVTVNYTYDALNRLTAIDYPGTEEDVTYTYDQGPNGIGRLSRIEDAGGLTEYTYDARGNVVEVAHQFPLPPAGEGEGEGGTTTLTTGYAYDNADNLTQITYPSGRTVDYSRDSAGQIQTVTTTHQGQTQTLAEAITYRPFGPVQSLTYGNGLTETRDYDRDGRVQAIDVPGVHNLDYGYDPNSNIETIEALNELDRTQSFDYDLLDRLTGADGAYGNLGYAYDPVDNRTEKTAAGQAEPYSYGTDSHHLLQRAATQYQYDAAGNTTHNGEYAFSYNAANRLSGVEQAGDPVADYRYNALGQRTMKITDDRTVIYVYDLNGRLIAEVNADGQTRKAYVYRDSVPLAVIAPDAAGGDPVEAGVLDTDRVDPLGPEEVEIRVKGRGGVWKANLVNTGAEPLSGPLYYEIEGIEAGVSVTNAEAVSSAGHPVIVVDVDQVPPGGVIVFEVHFQGLEISGRGPFPYPAVAYQSPDATEPGARVYHVLTDHLGTPQALTDENQTVVWRASYDPFGQATVDEDPDGDGYFVTNNLRFPGQYFDEETGLHYNWNRYYYPNAGRYITSDPIGLEGGVNTYLYAFANPITNTDFTGLAADSVTAACRQDPFFCAMMAGAAGKAASNAADTEKADTGDPNCPEEDDCERLKKQLKKVMKDLYRRYMHAARGRRGTAPGSVKDLTHREQYENKQRQLSKIISQMHSKGCSVPNNAYAWSATPYPDKPTTVPPPNY